MAAEKLEKSQHLVEAKIDYQALEQQRSEALEARLRLQLRAREVGKSASLRRVVLRFVADGKYQDATGIIEEYLELKSAYPAIKKRTSAHVNHAKELVNAIRAKRHFPNLSQLAMSKQQEILDHAISHFEELKHTLKHIEAIVKSEAIHDMRSTVMVLRTACYIVFAVVFGLFFMEFAGSVGRPLWSVFNDFVNLLFKLMVSVFS